MKACECHKDTYYTDHLVTLIRPNSYKPVPRCPLCHHFSLCRQCPRLSQRLMSCTIRWSQCLKCNITHPSWAELMNKHTHVRTYTYGSNVMCTLGDFYLPYIHTYIHTYVCMYVCMFIFTQHAQKSKTYVRTYMCAYMYVRPHINVCILVHLHTYTPQGDVV